MALKHDGVEGRGKLDRLLLGSYSSSSSAQFSTTAQRRRHKISHLKQGVALTGRNTTGPPCSVTDVDRYQRAKQYWSPYTLCVGGPVVSITCSTGFNFDVSYLIVNMMFSKGLVSRPWRLYLGAKITETAAQWHRLTNGDEANTFALLFSSDLAPAMKFQPDGIPELDAFSVRL